LSIDVDSDITAFKQMVQLNNSHQYSDLLVKSTEMHALTPGWLTLHLFDALAYLGLNDNTKAREAFAKFNRVKGPAYEAGACKQMADYLDRELR
jgi:hypothetical protein